MTPVKFIKVGMTRAEVEKLFHSDCGNDKSNECNSNERRFINERYVSNDCHCQGNKTIQVDLNFRPSGIDDQTYKDPILFQKWIVSHLNSMVSIISDQDIVSKISGPYCEYLSCADKLNFIKAGMTRADLEKSFEQEGGLSDGYTDVGYVLKDCFCQGGAKKYIKILVSFKPFGMDDATYKNPDLFNKWTEKAEPWGDPKDIITNISQPFCGYGIAD